MKRLFAFLFSLILGFSCLFSFSACDMKKDPATTIKVGVIEYAPLTYCENGTFEGFLTELATKTFKALGYSVEFVIVAPQNQSDLVPNANDVYTAIENGDIDCFWGALSNDILFDEQRADFSHAFLKNPLCVVSSSNNASSLNDLENKKIAFGKNSAGEIYFNEIIFNTLSGVSSSCQLSQISALSTLFTPSENTDFALVDTLLALEQKYNGEYADLILNNVALEQNSSLRVVFKKQKTKNDLRDSVNAKLESFATRKTDGKCVITKIAENYFFGAQINLSDFIITDFDYDNGSGNNSGDSGSSSGGENGGGNGSSNGGSNTIYFPWI